MYIKKLQKIYKYKDYRTKKYILVNCLRERVGKVQKFGVGNNNRYKKIEARINNLILFLNKFPYLPILLRSNIFF